MNIFMLLQRAAKRLRTQDTAFHEATETTVAILRSSGVLPTKRSSLNGGLHKLVAGMIVEAHEHDTTVDVGTRRVGTFARFGYSTKVISYLDKAVETNLLSSQTGRAKGKLAIGTLLDRSLSKTLA